MLSYYNNKRKNAYHGYHEYQMLNNQSLAAVSMKKRWGTTSTGTQKGAFGPQMDLTPRRNPAVVPCKYLKNSGGPKRTRISDLFRVKEANSMTYDARPLKTKDLRVMDLDLKWTAGRLRTSCGP